MTAPVCIVGQGAFGTALAHAVAERTGERVWLVDQPGAPPPRLGESDLELHPCVAPTVDLAAAAGEARLVIVAVRSHRLAGIVRLVGDVTSGRHVVVHASGSLVTAEEGGPLLRVSELLRREVPTRRIGVLAGPTLPLDLAQRKPCALVCASAFDDVLELVRTSLASPPALRLYASHDLVGTEIASAASSAMVVALGLMDASGLGDGTRATLICRAVAEGSRLVHALGGEDRTFSGLAGLGNLLVRGSERSEDYLLGRTLVENPGSMHKPTEGSRSAKALCRLAANLGVRVPILTAVDAIANRGVPVAVAAHKLVEQVAQAE